MGHLNPAGPAGMGLEGRVSASGKRQMRRPPERYILEDWRDRPTGEVMAQFGVSQPTASRWLKWMQHQDRLGELAQFREENPNVHIGGLEGLPKHHWEWEPKHIPTLIEGFLEFRPRYFLDKGEPYVTPGFQQNWASSILSSLVSGARNVILAPVRHGKTELLTQICIYLWMLDPDIRVLWISATEKIAKKPIQKMRGVFMQNQKLIDDYAPEGTFVPPLRDPRAWGSSEFTLNTRTDFNVSGPNVMAAGRDGVILSLNADIIIVDDIESKSSVTQLAMRQETKEWWVTQLSSRKEEHTGLFVIGSRQHPDDLYGTLVSDPNWNVIVEKAHDQTCDIREDKEHTECMLWPEYRSHRWLLAQKQDADKYSPTYFDMAYQNITRSKGTVVFSEEDVHACRSPKYSAGTVPRSREGEGSVELVAGLDPAISGYQAAVLLAYQTSPELRIWLVDLDNTEGGGVGAAAQLIRRWHEKYGVTRWVAEKNLLGNLSEYKEITDYTTPHGIIVQNWRTDNNKNSQFFGVTALASLFTGRNIILPYADSDSKTLTDVFVSQLVVWDEGNSRNKNRTGVKDDLVMAFWFAWDPIRRARQDQTVEAVISHDGYDGFGFDYAPWEELALG